MVARLRLLSLPALLVSLLPLVWSPTAWAEQPSSPSSRCNNATLKGTYLYSSVGMLDGKPYAEAGREVYDGNGGVELTYRGTGGVTGTMRTTYTVSPDCIGKGVYPPEIQLQKQPEVAELEPKRAPEVGTKTDH